VRLGPAAQSVSGQSWRRLALAATVALVAYLGWGIFRAGLNEVPAGRGSTDIVFRQGTVSGQRIKTRSWTASYDRLVSNADQTVLELQNVHDGTIFRAGKPYLHVRAAHMSVNTITRDFSIVGPLHVKTVGAKPARWFDTTAAQWEDSAQRLTLSHHVTIYSGAEHPLSVGSLTFDVKTGNVAMNDVAGQIRFK
jgi:hypothetical protein